MSRLDLVYLRTAANPRRFLRTGGADVGFRPPASKDFFEPARRGIGILSFRILALGTLALGTLGRRKSVAENDFKNELIRARRKAVADAEIHVVTRRFA